MPTINCYFGVSKVCNLRCTYCYVPEYNKGHQADYDARALAAACRFAEKARREGLSIGEIALHGAEPTILSPQTFGRIINIFHALTGKEIGLQSNGTRLTPEYLDRLLHVIGDPAKLFVGISIDGSPAIHNPQRNNTWERVMGNIAALRARGFGIGVLAVITPLTMRHLPDFEAWVTQIKSRVDGLTFKLGEHGFGLTAEEKIAFADWLYATQNIKHLQAFMPNICIQDGNNCGFYEFDVDGHCYSCNKNYNTEGAFANWFEQSFAEIVARRDGLYRATPCHAECATCPIAPYCASGCPLTREAGHSVDCYVRKRVYLRLASDGIAVDRFFASERQSTVRALLHAALPIFCAQCATEALETSIAAFQETASLREMPYPQIVAQFVAFLPQYLTAYPALPPFLPELAEYEHARFTLTAQLRKPPAPLPESDPHVPLLDAQLVINPTMMRRHYRFPVQRITEATDPATLAPEATELLIYADYQQHAVVYWSLDCATAHFAETFLHGEAISVGQGLQRLARALDATEEDLVGNALAFLKTCHDASVIRMKKSLTL